jgi:hypothetical protein
MIDRAIGIVRSAGAPAGSTGRHDQRDEARPSISVAWRWPASARRPPSRCSREARDAAATMNTRSPDERDVRAVGWPITSRTREPSRSPIGMSVDRRVKGVTQPAPVAEVADRRDRRGRGPGPAKIERAEWRAQHRSSRESARGTAPRSYLPCEIYADRVASVLHPRCSRHPHVVHIGGKLGDKRPLFAQLRG